MMLLIKSTDYNNIFLTLTYHFLLHDMFLFSFYSLVKYFNIKNKLSFLANKHLQRTFQLNQSDFLFIQKIRNLYVYYLNV